MKPTLKNKPTAYIIKNLLSKFADGKPMDADQLNFLAWHEKTLSHQLLDPALKYYLKHLHHDYHDEPSFLTPTEVFNKKNTAQLKKRLTLLLKKEKSHVVIKLSNKQFEAFKKVTYQELILTHGNQLLSGAPFQPGGIPHTLFFQWGNLFGVAKYVVLPDEKALKSNFLIYFEDRQDREINTCIKEYIKTHEVPHQPKPAPSQTEAMPFHYKTPALTLKIHKNDEKEDKK